MGLEIVENVFISVCYDPGLSKELRTFHYANVQVICKDSNISYCIGKMKSINGSAQGQL